MAVNETFGWIWILTGVLAGLVLGLRFHQDDWLGGYATLRRRLVRLGHISFVGLGILNILFAHSAARMALDPAGLRIASIAFLVGGMSMPACCALMAWRRGLQPLFAVPVVSLLGALGVVVRGLLRP